MSQYRFEKAKEQYHIWNDFVEHNVSMYTIASNPSIGNIISETFGWDEEHLLIYKDDRLVAVFNYIKINEHLVSMPHFSYGGLLIAKNENIDIKDLYKDIFKSLNIFTFEIRSFQKMSEYSKNDKITSFLYLKDNSNEQLMFFKSKLRSQIKKGYKNKLNCKFGGIELLDEFYSVYSKNMHFLGSPVLSKAFFKNLAANYKNGDVKIFCVYWKNKVIGVSFVLTYLDFAEVCWASTLREYNYLSTNMVLYWEMIKYTIDNKMKVFSFGRGSKDGPTHKFKLQWGTEDQQLYFNYSEEQTVSLKNMKFLSKAWSKLPFQLVNYIGPKISKRLY